MKLDVKSFALTTGLIAGVGLFGMTWWLILFEGATGEPTIIGMVYRGFSISAGGSFIGLLWGFVDGAICGAAFAWLYNRLSGKRAEAVSE